MPGGPAVALDQQTIRPLSILVVHSELPMPDRHAGSLRLWRLVEALVADGHAVTFLARAGLGQEAYAAELTALGVEVLPVDPRRLLSAGVPLPGVAFDFEELMRRGRFDVAWLSFYDIAEEYLPEIRLASPATRVIVDTVDVHWVRERRGAELSGDPAELIAAQRTREREQRIYTQADALVAVTDDDAMALRELAPDVPVSVIGTVHADAPPGPGFGRRCGLVFVGNFDHAPNVDAMVHFHAAAWPEISRRLPAAELSIVGQVPPPSVQALAGPRVHVTGWVPDVVPYLDMARVSIAPLRYGAGVKGKIGEALSHGLPVVTTSIGAEGMGLIHETHALIADDATLADEVCRLHENRELWERLRDAGKAHITRHLSPDTAQDVLRALLAMSPDHSLIALDAWSDPARLRAILGGYLREFDAGASATLVLPAPAEQLSLAQAGALAERAIRDLGADPEQIPDVAVAESVVRPAVPRNARLVGSPPAHMQDAQSASQRPVHREDGVRVSIIICAYGKRGYSERCLASLERALGDRLGGSWELVLVDNASPDTTAELFSEWSDRAKIVSLATNHHFAGGNNAGAGIASGDVLIFLNNDTEVPAGALEALVEEAGRPGVGLVGTRLLYPDGRLQHGGFGWRPAQHTLLPFHLFHFEDGELAAASATYDIGAVTGACMAVRANVFHAVDGFDEGYVNGWEDIDLCLKVRIAGWRVRYRGDVHVIHHEGVTSGGRYNRDANMQRFAARWGRVVTDEGHLVRRTLGATFSPLAETATGTVSPDGAPVLVSGPVGTLGSAGDEARGLVAALSAGGLDVAARADAPSWVGPALAEAQWRTLLTAQARPAQPDALVLRFSPPTDDLVGPLILRLSYPIPCPGAGAVASVPSPALREALLDEGWPGDAVAVVPPVGIASAPGDGGGGMLVLLPSDLRAAAILLDSLRRISIGNIDLLPTTRSGEVNRLAANRLPGAKVLPPTTDERSLQRLAGGSDVVVALNLEDRFDRQALVAASAGAAVVSRPTGAAQAVLGPLSATAQPGDGSAIRAAVQTALEAAGERDHRAATVASACAAEALQPLLDLAGSLLAPA